MSFTKMSYDVKIFLISFSIFVLFVGCIERSLDTFENKAGFYSIYGSLDADSNLNYIRIKNTHLPVISDSLQQFDAQVLFEDVEEGVVTTLRDTIVDFSGFLTHNFIVDQELVPNKTYRVRVERSTDGVSVSSLVTIPGTTEVIVEPNTNLQCEQQFELTYKNVKHLEQVRMEVGVRNGANIQWAQIGVTTQLEYRMNTDEMFLQTTPENLVLEVFPPPFSEVTCDGVSVIYIRYKHLSKEWDILEAGQFPPDYTEWQDVENGSGFLGAFREGSFTLTIQD